MNPATIFSLMTPFGLIVFLLLGFWYVLPRLYREDYYNALVPLLLFSTFRYLGGLFVVPALSTGLAATPFAQSAAIGDLLVSGVALLGAIALRLKLKFGIGLAWLYFVLGSVDFVYAIYLANQSDIPSHIGSIWPVTAVGGPAFMVTLVLLVVALIKHPAKNGPLKTTGDSRKGQLVGA